MCLAFPLQKVLLCYWGFRGNHFDFSTSKKITRLSLCFERLQHFSLIRCLQQVSLLPDWHNMQAIVCSVCIHGFCCFLSLILLTAQSLRKHLSCFFGGGFLLGVWLFIPTRRQVLFEERLHAARLNNAEINRNWTELSCGNKAEDESMTIIFSLMISLHSVNSLKRLRICIYMQMSINCWPACCLSIIRRYESD